MLFNSFSFLVFFPVVTIAYFLTPHAYRWVLLLFASCVFYMAFIPYYIFILLITICIDYYAGIKIEQSSGKKRRTYLIVSVISTCLVLIVFKYFNFFNTNLTTLSNFFGLNYPIGFINIILPIGLSFHTFQSLSYVIEVYRGKQKAERHFGIYSLYVMFYPQLVAGPIERPQHLLHQFYEEHSADVERITRGLRKMLWGLFKKIVIADNLAVFVNSVYGNPHMYTGLTLLVTTFFFAIQIYCDFSGYSDIAIGSAQVMGFRLMDNFKNPYFASSIREFWQRWHISLSTWFRDYVYIPLGGNRVKKTRWYRNILVTFILSGLWHGANWTFMLWGLIHGIYLIFYAVTERFLQKILYAFNFRTSFILRLCRKASVFILVTFAWVFFRAATVPDALYIISSSLRGLLEPRGGLNELLLSFYNLTNHGVIFFTVILAVFIIAEIIDYKKGLLEIIGSRKAWLRFLIYTVMVLCIMNLGVTQEMKFIYFQF